MKFLYFDCPSGISGDMILAAFLDALVPVDYFFEEIRKLPISQEVEIRLETTERHAIQATRVIIKSMKVQHNHRHLKEIYEIIDSSSLSDYVKQNSRQVFQRLGKAEAEIHGIPLEKVHFHEVGAIDSIMDIVGAFICVEYLKPDKIFTSAVPLSKGVIDSAHGKIPIPAPATLALLKDFPTLFLHIDAELVTPTGAAILSHLTRKKLPEHTPFRIRKVGYGAGSLEIPELPNLLRIWQGEMDTGVHTDTALQIETNIDDMNPELFPYLMEKLFEAGVMDVSFYPNIMKKGRPGTLISILCAPEKLPIVRQILFRETTTLGLRYFSVNREKLPRQQKKIKTPWGEIDVKIVQKEGQSFLMPEYESCRKIAKAENISLMEVYQKISEYLRKKPFK